MELKPGQDIVCPTITQGIELTSLLGVAPYRVYSLHHYLQKKVLRRPMVTRSSTLLSLGFWGVIKKKYSWMNPGLSTAKGLLRAVRQMEKLNWRYPETLLEVAQATKCEEAFFRLRELLGHTWELEAQLGHESFANLTYYRQMSVPVSVSSEDPISKGFIQNAPWELEWAPWLRPENPNPTIPQKIPYQQVIEVAAVSATDLGLELPNTDPERTLKALQWMGRGLPLALPEFTAANRNLKVQSWISEVVLGKDPQPDSVQDQLLVGKIKEVVQDCQQAGVLLQPETFSLVADELPRMTPGYHQEAGIRVYYQDRIPLVPLKYLITEESPPAETANVIHHLPNNFWSQIAAAGLGVLPPDHPGYKDQVSAIRRSWGENVWEVAVPDCPVVTIPAPRPKVELSEVSVSDLVEYWKCPTRLWARLHDRVPPRTESLTGDPAELGTKVHQIIEQITKRRLSRQIDQFEQVWAQVDASMINWEGQPNQGIARRLLSNYLKIEKNVLWDRYQPIAVEERFSFPLATKVGILQVNGRIDRRDQGPDGQVVWDYKTGVVTTTPQLLLYQMAMPDVPYAGIIDLNRGTVVGAHNATAMARQRSRDRQLLEIQQCAEGILNQDFSPRPRNWNLCCGCPGRGVCGQ